jgi:hypothetical protein
VSGSEGVDGGVQFRGREIALPVQARSVRDVDDRGRPGGRLGWSLVDDGVDTVVVTGATTSGCVRATVVDACSHGYRTVVPVECVGDRAEEPHEANLFDMGSKYADLMDRREVERHLRAAVDGG